ncbi:MAG: extracellular solute-binding protein [Anaerolineae bacterium]|nr:extracellular solute-binding protein [Anaerolineae bacterium]
MPKPLPSPSPSPTRFTITIEAMHYPWDQFAQKISPSFKETFPNTTIRWRVQGDWRSYPQRIAALEASGTLGDLVETSPGTLLAFWAQNGLIRPLDELLLTEGFDTSGILHGVLEACYFKGQLVALPYLGHPGASLLLYNKELFAQAKLTLPDADWTLQDLQRVCQAFQRARTCWGYFPYVHLPQAYPSLYLFGAHLFSQDGKRSAVQGEKGQAYLSWLTKLSSFSLSPSRMERSPLYMFRTGQLAMLRHSFSTFQTLLSDARLAPHLGCTLFPQHPQTRARAAVATGIAYCITKASHIPQQALRWIKFLSSSEMGVQMFLQGYAEPGCRITSWKDPRVLEQAPICAQLAELADQATPPRLPWNLRTAECLQIWNREITRFLNNEKSTPEGCLQTISQELERVLHKPSITWEELSPSL